MADHADVLRLIESVPLIASGIGYVDAHLLASARLDANIALMARDKRLAAAASAARVRLAAFSG